MSRRARFYTGSVVGCIIASVGGMSIPVLVVAVVVGVVLFSVLPLEHLEHKD